MLLIASVKHARKGCTNSLSTRPGRNFTIALASGTCSGRSTAPQDRNRRPATPGPVLRFPDLAVYIRNFFGSDQPRRPTNSDRTVVHLLKLLLIDHAQSGERSEAQHRGICCP